MAKVPKKYKVIIKEYVLNEVPKIFAPDEVVNVPEWFLTDEVLQLIYDSWQRECLIKEQRSKFLESLYQRARGKFRRQTYEIDANYLEFEPDVFESRYKNCENQPQYPDLFG